MLFISIVNTVASAACEKTTQFSIVWSIFRSAKHTSTDLYIYTHVCQNKTNIYVCLWCFPVNVSVILFYSLYMSEKNNINLNRSFTGKLCFFKLKDAMLIIFKKSDILMRIW